MPLSSLFPKSFTLRLILMSFLSGITPIVIFAMLINSFGGRFLEETTSALERGQLEQWQRSRLVLEQMAENIIRQKALDVALQIELYLSSNPAMELDEILQSPRFRELAVQALGKTGYTALLNSKEGSILLHRNRQYDNLDLGKLANSLPEMWNIIQESVSGRYSHGYYQWREPDGQLRDKFMYIVPVGLKSADGTTLSVAATAYMDEFTQPITAAQDVSRGSSHLLTLTLTRLIGSLKTTGYLFMGASITLVLLLAAWIGIYFSKAFTHLRQATRAVNKGDYSVRLSEVMSGEVGDLLKDFNTMVGNLATTTVQKAQLEKKERQLQNTNDKLQLEIVHRQKVEETLKRYQEDLERLVEQRTIKLIEVNQQLREQSEERKAAVDALKSNEDRLTAILHASPVGIGLVVDRKLQWANERMYQLVGYPSGSLLNLDARILYPEPEEYERVGAELLRQAANEGIADINTRWVRQSGEVFECNIRGVYTDPASASRGMIVAISDISEARKLERKLRQAQKMEALGTLAGGVAHDLNNILSGIVTYPELLLMDLAEDSPWKNPLLTIKSSGENAAAVVQDLLTMARRGVSVSKVLDLNEVIRAQLQSPEFHKLRTQHPEVEVRANLALETLRIKGSPPHLAKALMNLVRNGAEAIETGGVVAIETHLLKLEEEHHGYELIAPGSYAVLTVADTGKGLRESEQTRIFEPFYTTKKMGRSGTGLGMAVVWGTVKDHEGAIDIQSGKGVGTTFSLYFPITQDHLVVVKEDNVADYQGSGQHVLVVDDSQQQREIARRALEKLNYQVSTVASGEEAVAFWKRQTADLVLLDMIMEPGMDGLETYQKLASMGQEPRLIIVSGYSESDRVKHIQQRSGCRYIRKPYTVYELGKVLLAEFSRKG